MGIGAIRETVESPGVIADLKTSKFDPDKVLDNGEPIQIVKKENSCSSVVPVEHVANDNETSGDTKEKGSRPEGKNDEKFVHVSDRAVSRRVYLDDKNRVYRVGDNLLANFEYTINGYQYRTDDKGRITCAEGRLYFRDRDSRLTIKDSSEVIGKGSQRATDDRSHIIADLFNGGNGLENIIPMDSELNRSGQYKKIENRLAAALGDGCSVTYKVELKYSDDTRRPSGFVVTDVIDGETTVTVFRNEGTNRNG